MITIFTDGAARGNPGPGGWGAVVLYGDKVLELGGREKHTTNNRMEMTAVISALEKFSGEKKLQINTDSAYVLNGSTRWIFGWQKNEWQRKDAKTKKAEELLNADLWQKIYSLILGKNIEWKLIKGHSGNSANERCDEIATSFADDKKIVLFDGLLSDYKVNLFEENSEKKSGNTYESKKSKSPAYSYISKVDGQIFVDKTWDECKARVLGKSGALFKKSFSKEDEEKIIDLFQKSGSRVENAGF